jgi:hypothetical protein
MADSAKEKLKKLLAEETADSAKDRLRSLVSPTSRTPKKQIPRPDPGLSFMERIVGRVDQGMNQLEKAHSGTNAFFNALSERVPGFASQAELRNLPNQNPFNPRAFTPGQIVQDVRNVGRDLAGAPERLRKVGQGVADAAKEGYQAYQKSNPKNREGFRAFSNVLPEDASKAERLLMRGADIAAALQTDPTNLVLTPSVKVAGKALRGAAKLGAATKPAKAFERNILNPAGDWINKRLVETEPGAVVNRWLGFAGFGSHSTLRKTIEAPYQRKVQIAAETVRNGILQPIAQHTQELRRNPKMRAAFDDISAASGGANPVAELVRWRAEDIMDEAISVHTRAPKFGLTPATTAKLQGPQARAQRDRVLEVAQQFGVKPDLIEELAQRMVTTFDDVERTVAQVAPKRIKDETRKKRFLSFQDDVLGKRPEMRGPKEKPTPVNPRLVHEAGLRHLVHNLANEGKWVRPMTEASPTPGWVPLKSVKGMNTTELANMEIPAPLHAMLDVESARAGMRAGSEAQTNYIKGLDTLMWMWKETVGGVKRGLIGNPATQVANVVSNNIVVDMGLRRNGVKVSPDAMQKFVRQAGSDLVRWRRSGKASADLEELRLYSNAIDSTFVDTVLQTGNKGNKFTKAAGKLSPVNWMVDMQGFNEQAYKLAMYRMLKPKLGARAAAAQVDKYLFDYSDRSVWLEIADKYGVWPFNAYTTKSLGLLLDTVMSNPEELVKYPRLMALANQGYNTENKQKMPSRYQSAFMIPYGDTQNPEYVDVQRYIPFGAALEAGEEGLGAGNILGGAMSAAGLGRAGNNPLEQAANASLFARGYGILRGISPFSESDAPKGLLAPGQPANELQGTVLKELARNYAPSIAGGRAFQAVQESRAGVGAGDYSEPRTMQDVFLQYGLGLRTVKGETPAERGARMAPEKAKRAAAVAPVFAEAFGKAMQSPTDDARKKRIARLTKEEAGRKATEMQKYLHNTLHTSTRIVNTEGKVVDKARIDNAAKELAALIRRATGQE